jgi:hypothetical protein
MLLRPHDDNHHPSSIQPTHSIALQNIPVPVSGLQDILLSLQIIVLDIPISVSPVFLFKCYRIGCCAKALP